MSDVPTEFVVKNISLRGQVKEVRQDHTLGICHIPLLKGIRNSYPSFQTGWYSIILDKKKKTFGKIVVNSGHFWEVEFVFVLMMWMVWLIRKGPSTPRIKIPHPWIRKSWQVQVDWYHDQGLNTVHELTLHNFYLNLMISLSQVVNTFLQPSHLLLTQFVAFLLIEIITSSW